MRKRKDSPVRSGESQRSDILAVVILELDSEFADKGLLSTVYIREHFALPPVIFEAGVDKRHRVPEQVDVGRLKLLVHGDRRGWPDQGCRNVVIGKAIGYVRSQIGQPPVLVTKLQAELRDRLDQDVGRRSGARAARSWRCACRRAKEVGRQRRVGVVVQVAADPIARAELKLEVILCPA